MHRRARKAISSRTARLAGYLVIGTTLSAVGVNAFAG